MSTRDLHARWTGDASEFIASAKEVQSGAAATGAALASSGNASETVSKSFLRTGKAFKATGKVFKSSGLDALTAGHAFSSMVPALAGVSSGAGQALTAVDALSGVLTGAGPAGLAAVGIAAVGAAGAYALLHDDVSAATDALNAQSEANKQVAASHDEVVKSVNAHKDSLEALQDDSVRNTEAANALEEANRKVAEAAKAGGKNSLDYRDAQVKLEQATVRVADADRKHGQDSVQYRSALIAREKATRALTDAENAGGKGSKAYADALVEQRKAQDEVARSKRATFANAEEAIRQTHATREEIEKETAAARKNGDAARDRAQQLQRGFLAGKDAAGVAKEIHNALTAESRAVATSAAKHKDNAQRALEMASAIGTATPRAKGLHDRLVELANVELNLAAQAAAIRSVGSAASFATQQVSAFVARVNSAQGLTVGQGIRVGAGSASGKKSNEVNPATKSEDARRALTPRAGELNAITRSDRADAEIAARARDNSLQDTLARERANVSGITNPDKIAAIQDKEVAEVRKKELTQDAATVQKARQAVERDIGKKRATKAAKIKTRRKTPQRIKQKNGSYKDNPAWQKLTDAIDALTDSIRSLWDEHRTLGREYADIQAEAAEIGHTIGNLTSQIASLPDAVPADTSTSDASTSGDTASSPSPDQQAQLDQANARAQAATAQANSTDAFLRSLAGGANIDPATVAPMIQYNVSAGMVVRESDLAAYFVKSVASQPFIRRSVFPSAA